MIAAFLTTFYIIIIIIIIIIIFIIIIIIIIVVTICFECSILIFANFRRGFLPRMLEVLLASLVST